MPRLIPFWRCFSLPSVTSHLSSSANWSVKLPGPETPIIQCLGVSKSYGDVRILEDFNLEVAAGEKVAIIGPSGSGKSTILRLLMGLETYQSGRILIAGKLLPREKFVAQGHDVGLVFQHFNLFPHMTALENVMEAPVRVLKLSQAQARQRARDLFAKVGLEGHDDAYPAQLSGGEQQRVAIARALAMQPKVLLFDEVTSALDPELVGGVLTLLRRLAAESGVTMLLVTQEMTFARDVSDRVIFMETGRIIEQGPPSLIFNAPQNERTKIFLRQILER
jgi:polar amino acid transport system ATP-binding protein